MLSLKNRPPPCLTIPECYQPRSSDLINCKLQTYLENKHIATAMTIYNFFLPVQNAASSYIRL